MAGQSPAALSDPAHSALRRQPSRTGATSTLTDPVAPTRGRWVLAAPPLLAAALLVGMALPRLGRRPLWLDETYTVGATHDLLATWRGSGGTMALYYLLMTPVSWASTDRFWMRLPSLLFAALTVMVVYEIGRRIAGRRAGTLAAGTLAVSWALTRYAIEARSYTLALLLVGLSWLGLVAAVQSEAEDPDSPGARRWWRLFVVAALLAPLAHGMAALHFVSQMAALGLAPHPRRWWRRALPVGVALAIEGAGLFAVGAGEVADWIAPLQWSQVESILRVLLGRGPVHWLVGALALGGAALAIANRIRTGRPAPDPGGLAGSDGLPDQTGDLADSREEAGRTTGAGDPVELSDRTEGVAGSRTHRDVATAAAWGGVVPVFWALGAPVLLIVLSTVRPYAESRYVIGALPGIALLVGGVLARLRPRVVALVAWLAVAALLLRDHRDIGSMGREDWPGLADHLAAEAEPGDQLLTPAKLRPAFDYAWTAEGGDQARPPLAPLSPTDPIDEVQRFYDAAPGGLRNQLLADDSHTVWYVDRDDNRRDDVDALVADPAIRARYEITGPLVFPGELYLVRLEPRPPGDR